MLEMISAAIAIHHPPSKQAKRDRSLERHNSISDCAQLIRSAFVHHHGIPISQPANAGFNRLRSKRSGRVVPQDTYATSGDRGREERLVSDDDLPSGIVGTRRENI